MEMANKHDVNDINNNIKAISSSGFSLHVAELFFGCLQVAELVFGCSIDHLR